MAVAPAAKGGARRATAVKNKLTPTQKAPAKVRARPILTKLAKAYPDWGPTLEFATPLDLLVATILAAQARDERINEITRDLFKRYRTAQDYVRIPQATLEREIRASGFFRNKARAVKGMAQGLVERFDGRVPDDMEGLTSLYGVGRKTASIVLGAAFGKPAIAVDRHVERVATRLGMSKKGTDGTERGLAALYPKRDWYRVTWTFVLHGRRTCMPTPACPRCPVLDLCPYTMKTTM
ncbi:MAG: endonuclease III [Chloroflexi bacterium]|nr:endonuclease III [Chloroflexota bacterium]